MTFRTLLTATCVVLSALLLLPAAASAGEKVPPVPLTEHGEKLHARYADMLETLRKEIVAAVPTVDESKKSVFVAAHTKVAEVPPQPNPNGLRLAPPRYAPSHELYAEAQEKAVEAAAPLLAELDGFLADDAMDAKLAKCALMAHATPRGLAVFAQQGAEQEALIDELLADDALMLRVMKLGGCYQGKYGQAMEIYKAIQAASKHAHTGFLQAFALASSMEHPDGSVQKQGMTPAEVNVEIYLDFEKAYFAGHLDEAFDSYSDFNYRFVMFNHHVEDLRWMRTMLRNYRPDHIRNPDYKWRYCRIVKTDVPYTTGLTGRRPLRPDLETTRYQDFFLEGGICGPRAFTGKLSTSAFGIPSRGATQTGHAAFCHWTPDGWTPVFGAHWTFNRYRGITGLDFSLEERARSEPEQYNKVLRAEWVGDAFAEAKVSKSSYGVGGDFWNALAFYKKLAIVEEARIAELEITGEELAESNEEAVAEEVKQIPMTEADKTVVIGDDGVITVPVGACHKPENTEKIRFMRTIEGDALQVHYALGGKRPELLKYYIEAPAAGKYQLIAEVCTVTVDRTMMLRLNRRTYVDIALPYTRGEWQATPAVTVELKEGRNSFQFTIKAPNKGVSIKQFKLQPVN